MVGDEGVDAQIEQIDGLDLALQGQLVGQINLSGQRGVSVATAVSDDVTVDQALDLTAWDGDGIDAISSAKAIAPVVQTATQSNTNSATATFEGSQAGVVAEAGTPQIQADANGAIGQFDELDIALQGQLVGQVNLSGQHGLAVATAISDDVTVTSGNVSAGGNGIKAVSSAKAVAPVVQTATQSNTNTATATFEGNQASLDLQATRDVSESILSDGGINLGLQGQLVGQVNLSVQAGASIATALSDEVNVTQSGDLEAGGNGIVAKSSAKAVAPVVQTATQSNNNSAEATFTGSQENFETEAGNDTRIAIGVNRGIDVALQGQLVGQINLSGQFGASVATAVSDDVTVNQFGTINAWDGDGIAAASTAEAIAAVVQTGSQSNTNSAEATFNPGQLVVNEGEPEPLNSENIALQGQLAGQFNLSAQAGLAISTAISDEVTVSSGEDPAGGDGINATSSAQSVAAVVQTLGTETDQPGQSNVNTAAINVPENTEAEPGRSCRACYRRI